MPVRILRGLKFNKNLGAKKDVPDCPEREGKSYLQTCPPSLDATSLSVTGPGEIELNSSASPLPPDLQQNTTDLPKPRKRQTSLDTPRKKHRGINEATTDDASKLGDCNNFELDSPAPDAEITVFDRSVVSSTSESTRIEFDETLLSLPSNVPKRDVEAHPAQGKQNVDMTPTQETPITSCIPFSPAQSSYEVSGLQGTVEGVRHEYVQSMLINRGMEEEINLSENWLGAQELDEDFILDCEDPAATEMEDRPINIFPTHKPPLCVNPPIWAQVCDNTLRYNKLSVQYFFSSPAKKFVKPLTGSGAIKAVFILRTMQ